MNRFITAASIAGALALLSTGLTAQTSLAVGQTVSGTLAESAPTVGEFGRAVTYQLRLRAGERIVASMSSEAFDSYLSITRAGDAEELGSDDDGGEGVNARLRFTAPADGSYTLLAQALDAEGMGDFTLTLEAGREPAPVPEQTIRVGGTVNGALTDTDAVLETDDTYYDLYRVRAPAGTRLVVDMRSEDFDTFLTAGTGSAQAFEDVESDDDGGEGTNSLLRVTVPAGGELLIRANSLGEGTGDYTLKVTEGAPAGPAPTPRAVTAGQEVSGELAEGDAVLDDDSFYDYWSYRGRAGERVRVSMSSEDFDTFLAVGTLAGGEFELLESNDDGEEGTNSVIEVAIPAGGVLVIRTNSLSGGDTGAYRLRVDPAN